MRFYDRRHLVTGSEDNKICIVKAAASWNVEKTLCKHQGAVTDLAVHPSGKLMLSIGEDNKLITWNLIKGRCVVVRRCQSKLTSAIGSSHLIHSPAGKIEVVKKLSEGF